MLGKLCVKRFGVIYISSHFRFTYLLTCLLKLNLKLGTGTRLIATEY